jgi:hypothetical protein
MNMKYNNCWEFWSCPQKVRSECPAFLTNYGMFCYDFSENYCPRTEKGFKHCRECPWYKTVQSEIGQREQQIRL